MRFNINGVEYMVQWKHWLPVNTPPIDPKKPELLRPNVDPKRPHGGTDATLFILNDKGEKEIVYKVEMNCFHNDQFSYEDGRIQTLTKLLNFKRKFKKIREFFLAYGATTGTPTRVYIEKDSDQLDDEGLFKRADRTAIWEQYFLSKLPSEKDLRGQYDLLRNQLMPDLERLANLALALGMVEGIEFIPDESEDEDEPRQ